MTMPMPSLALSNQFSVSDNAEPLTFTLHPLLLLLLVKHRTVQLAPQCGSALSQALSMESTSTWQD